MSEIDNAGSVNPRARKLYEQEYRHGAALFEKALVQSNKSSYAPQKEQFSGVMEMAMKVLNQSAAELKRQDLIEQNKKIAHDYKAYQSNPSKERLDLLKSDLDKAKKSIEQ
jgi:hypothetical protein